MLTSTASEGELSLTLMGSREMIDGWMGSGQMFGKLFEKPIRLLARNGALLFKLISARV